MNLTKRKIAIAIIAFLLGLLVSTQALAGKKACESLKRQYQNQQKALKHQGRGESRNRKLANELTLFKSWQRCEQGKYKPQTKKKRKKQNQLRNKQSKPRASKLKQTAQAWQQKVNNGLSDNQLILAKTVSVSSAIPMRLQQAWLDFYQRPKKCIRPKSTQVFAFCIEHERQSQQQFLSMQN
ncbi:hypothetical protein [Thalassotalea fusca]